MALHQVKGRVREVTANGMVQWVMVLAEDPVDPVGLEALVELVDLQVQADMERLQGTAHQGMDKGTGKATVSMGISNGPVKHQGATADHKDGDESEK